MRPASKRTGAPAAAAGTELVANDDAAVAGFAGVTTVALPEPHGPTPPGAVDDPALGLRHLVAGEPVFAPVRLDDESWRLPTRFAYTSEHAHSSAEKGIRIAGMFAEQLRVIPSDGEHAMDPVKLREAMVAMTAADILRANSIRRWPPARRRLPRYRLEPGDDIGRRDQ